MQRAAVLGTGSCLPEGVLTNNELEKMVDTSDEWITSRTGIRTRRIAGSGEQNYQLALNQFNMDILSSDKLLIAFNDMITSRLNYSSVLANLLFSKSKIDINNTIQ